MDSEQFEEELAALVEETLVVYKPPVLADGQPAEDTVSSETEPEIETVYAEHPENLQAAAEADQARETYLEMLDEVGGKIKEG